ncbi:hypothetical protein A5791_20780 [Mycobacterium sp. 852002-51163_SCH5372311]|uniref:glycohydrolase toxin TNT-related protein n=1 Tax=Mycobacterium sp. 852002-51163_SCH5372311 TaxID=1834097 RepID=UPI0007FD1E3A|nr:glycohydrolase toxin TNT-related protein [Mycobacterium sp. 852002-51163_SCH5372311]OBF86269.1 hypothetical protein A5791_20780 [Mycobacterium sp. 852002-51163_SCH5372311]
MARGDRVGALNDAHGASDPAPGGPEQSAGQPDSHHGDAGHHEIDPAERGRGVPSQPDAERARGMANGALWKRIPPVSPDEVRHHLADKRFGEQRARDNVAWWRELSGEEQRALIDAYPYEIGNAEGVPAWARNEANQHQLTQRLDELQSRTDAGERLTRGERKELRRYADLQRALDNAKAEAAHLGGEVHILAFDPKVFHGDGRMVVSVGHDPHRADSVSWHVPGVTTTIDKLGGNLGNALNHLKSVAMENPDGKTASIAWIGYDAPSGKGIFRMAFHGLASEGGAILHSDIAAFNAGIDGTAAHGEHFSNNHIFGHSYGSTTTSYAGRNGQLAGHVHSITLAGSPGAALQRHASDFGIGEHVFVASSSRDIVTALGARSPGSLGRFFGVGLGVDPAMAPFGAHRVNAEFPRHMDLLNTFGTHTAYYEFDPVLGVRTESLANFGRIAAGHFDDVHIDAPRTERPWWQPGLRTDEPAQGRPLRLDETNGQYSVERRIWDARWHSGHPDTLPPVHEEVPGADDGTPPEHHDHAPAAGPPSRDYDVNGRTIPTDQLTHPQAGLLDESLLDGAAANPHRVSDALAPGAPSTHPEVQNMLPDSYHPNGGLTQAEWNREYWPTGQRDAHGNPELVWPDPQTHPQGFSSPENRTPGVLNPGQLFDRFGPGFGVFGSPVGTLFPERALPPHSLDAGYHRYEVVRPIPIWEGRIAPAMGQPGGGVQYYFTRPIVDLVNAGYLKEIPL